MRGPTRILWILVPKSKQKWAKGFWFWMSSSSPHNHICNIITFRVHNSRVDCRSVDMSARDEKAIYCSHKQFGRKTKKDKTNINQEHRPLCYMLIGIRCVWIKYFPRHTSWNKKTLAMDIPVARAWAELNCFVFLKNSFHEFHGTFGTFWKNITSFVFDTIVPWY